MNEEKWGSYDRDRDKDKLYLTSAPKERKTIDSAKPIKQEPGPKTKSLDTKNLEGRLCREQGGVTHLREGVEYCTKPHVYCISQKKRDSIGIPCGEKLR